MMTLHSRINKNELKDIERFEFLMGDIRKLVIRMDELHPSTDNDSHYLFLIWTKPDRTEDARQMILQNLKRSDLDREWHSELLTGETGDGLLILSTWI